MITYSLLSYSLYGRYVTMLAISIYLTCYFAIWRQSSLIGCFAASTKKALSLILTQTLTLILTLNPTLTLTQIEEKHYFAS